MTSSNNTNGRLRWLLAVVALLVAGVAYWWPASASEPKEQQPERDPAGLAAWVQEAHAEAAASDRYVLLYFDDDAGSLRLRDGPGDAFESEVLFTHVARKLFEEQVLLVTIDVKETLLRWHLPEPVQWLALVRGGERIHEMTKQGDAYVGDTYAAQVEWMPQFVLCRADGRPVAILDSYRLGGAAQFVAEAESSVAMAKRFDEALARADTLSGAERARAMMAALDRLEPWICRVAFVDELRELVSLDADNQLGIGEPARKELEIRRLDVARSLVCDVVGRDPTEHSPGRVRTLLAPLRERYAQQHHVLQFAAAMQAQVDLGGAINEQQWQRIREDVQAALALAPESSVAPALEQTLTLIEYLKQKK